MSKMPRDYPKLKQALDRLVKEHRTDEALRILDESPLDEIPRPLIPAFANLARRMDRPLMAMKILWPEIYDHKQPSAEFLFEYASTLRRLGLCNQTRQWLSRLPNSPRNLLERGFNHMHQWEYRDAKAIFSELVETQTAHSEINLLVVKVNLMACHVYLDEANEALEVSKGLSDGLAESHLHLYLNSLELKSQAYLILGRLGEAEQTLTRAMALINSQQGTTFLFIQKWLVILKVKRGILKPNDPQVDSLKNLARSMEAWETLRDLDFQLSQIANDHQLVSKVYYGTPFESYKHRILNRLGLSEPQDRYLWRDLRSRESITNLNLVFDPLRYFHPGLAFGQIQHRLICLLLSDHYRPFSVTRIFDLLFPDELYNPYTAEKRVHNLISSTRKNLRDIGLPMEISSTKWGYRLRPSDSISFLLPSRLSYLSQTELISHALKDQFGSKTFTRSEAESRLPLSKEQWQRLLKQLSTDGAVQTLGQGRALRYKVAA